MGFKSLQLSVVCFAVLVLVTTCLETSSAFRIDRVEWRDFAFFNETCYTGNGKQCATGPPFNFVCSPETSSDSAAGLCRCSPGYVYVVESEICWPIPTAAHHPCVYDLQCRAGVWGTHSRCNRRTERCECFADFIKYGRKLAYWKAEDGGRCHLSNPIDLCRVDNDCVKKIGTGSFCKLESKSMHGYCECQEGTHIWYPDKGNCLPLATKEGDACQVNEQCTASLGTFSRCYSTFFGTNCECYSPTRGLRTMYYPKTRECFPEKKLGDHCSSISECKASLGEAVECDGQLVDQGIEIISPSVKTCRRIQLGDWCRNNEDCTLDTEKVMICDKSSSGATAADEENMYEGRCALTGNTSDTNSKDGLRLCNFLGMFILLVFLWGLCYDKV